MPPLLTGIGSPWGLATAPDGAVYIAARDLDCVFRVESDSVRIVAGQCGTTSYHPRRMPEPGRTRALEGLPARVATLHKPSGVAVDRDGNLYIAEAGGHRIRRIDFRTRALTTVAGSGRPGYGSDGLLATQTALDEPGAMAIDGSGNLYVAQSRLHRVRRIDAQTGVITSIAGTGEPGSRGDGQLAAAAQLFSPSGLACRDSKLVIADRGNRRIRRVDLQSGLIDTIAGGNGKGARVFRDPIGLAIAPSGEIFVADAEGHRIFRVDVAGRTSVFAGSGRPGLAGDGGPAPQSLLLSPTMLAYGPGGRLLIADTGNRRVRAVESGVIRTVAGDGGIGYVADGPATSAFLRPEGFAFDGHGNLYVADGASHRLRFVDASKGLVSTIAGNGIPGLDGDGGPAAAALLDAPGGVALDSTGNVYVADTGNRRIRRIDHITGQISTLAGTSTLDVPIDTARAAETHLQAPVGIAFGPDGTLFLSDGARILGVDVAAGTVRSVAAHLGPGLSPSPGVASLPEPRPDLRGIAVDAAGQVFVTDLRSNRVFQVDPRAGTVRVVAGSGMLGAPGEGEPATQVGLRGLFRLGLDARGNLLLPDPSDHCVRILDRASGLISTLLDQASIGEKEIPSFFDARTDPAGTIWVTNGGRIQRVDLDAHRLVTVAGGGRGF